MTQFKIANVLLENNPRSFSYPSLYCRYDAPVFFSHTEHAWELYGPGTFDFTTYFNSLSIRKIRKFTVAQKVHLHLELKGSACVVEQTMADTFATQPQPLDDSAITLDESPDEYRTVDFELAEPHEAVLVGFRIRTKGQVYLKNSYYYADVEQNDLAEVNLVLSTTTFKKEKFVEHNVDLVRREIIQDDPEIAQHFRMFVIDNGRTLDKDALDGDGITVFPNPNAGGAGGFARGMIEAQRIPSFKTTNILLMDDDVSVSPESIKRTYWLLRILKPEYRNSFISGAMLNYEVGEDQWEDIGYITPSSNFAACKPPLRMTILHDIVQSEQFVPTEEQRENMYAAWWYCVIPISTIQKQGYPLPFFVRCDDAEYGTRCHPNIITLNGICIWHMAFSTRYNAAVERYQSTRNIFIAQATTGVAKNADPLGELHNNIQVELKNFNYDDAELLLDGFEDFMKGPQFIGRPVAEECFMRANRKAEKHVPFKELREMTKDIPGFDLDKLDNISIYRDKRRTRGEALVDFITFNRQRVMKETDNDFAVIPTTGWIYLPGKTRGKNTLIAIDTSRRTGIVRHRNIDRFNEIMHRYHDDLNKYRKNKAQLEKDYSAARDWLTSKEMWINYLGLNKSESSNQL